MHAYTLKRYSVIYVAEIIKSECVKEEMRAYVRMNMWDETHI